MDTPVSKQTIQSFLMDSGIDAYCPSDCYALPAMDWITGAFSDGLRVRQSHDDTVRFQSGRNVCHHYTRHAAVHAAMCHLKTHDTGEGESSLAFGWIDFIRPDGTGHSVNLAVCRDESERLFVVYFEPQTRSLVSPVWKDGTVPFAEI